MTPTELRALAKLTVTDDGETMLQVSKRDLRKLTDDAQAFGFFCGLLLMGAIIAVAIFLAQHK